MKRNWLVLCLLTWMVFGVSAQGSSVTVPDVTGMNAPQAERNGQFVLNVVHWLADGR